MIMPPLLNSFWVLAALQVNGVQSAPIQFIWWHHIYLGVQLEGKCWLLNHKSLIDWLVLNILKMSPDTQVRLHSEPTSCGVSISCGVWNHVVMLLPTLAYVWTGQEAWAMELGFSSRVHDGACKSVKMLRCPSLSLLLSHSPVFPIRLTATETTSVADLEI